MAENHRLDDDLNCNHCGGASYGQTSDRHLLWMVAVVLTAGIGVLLVTLLS
jgi:hypothetical protein